MSKILDSSSFGDKLYKSLPELYRSEDADVNFTLKRYLQALSDGGFAKVIEETNNILSLVDSEKVDAKLLPVLFKSYGLEIFNGVPEMYLRKLLPTVSKLFSLKGTVTAVEYLTSIISGVKSSIEVSETFSIDHAVDVILEMDYGAEQSEIPEREQLLRIIREFVPFFCNVTIVYSYFFNEDARIYIQDVYSRDLITYTSGEQTVFNTSDAEITRKVKNIISESGLFKTTEILKDDVLDLLHRELTSVKYLDALISDVQVARDEAGTLKTEDTEKQEIKMTEEEKPTPKAVDYNSLIGDVNSVLNDTFLLNNISSYDIIRETGKEDTIFFN